LIQKIRLLIGTRQQADPSFLLLPPFSSRADIIPSYAFTSINFHAKRKLALLDGQRQHFTLLPSQALC